MQKQSGDDNELELCVHVEAIIATALIPVRQSAGGGGGKRSFDYFNK